MDGLVAIVSLVALLIGLAIGWLLWGRALGAARDERARTDDRARTAETALALARQQADQLPQLSTSIERLRDERDEARRGLAALAPVAERAGTLEHELRVERERVESLAAAKAAYERGEAERARAHEAQLAQLKEMEAKLEARFGEMATRALGDAQAHFLKRADERFKEAETSSEAKIKAVLAPVEITLKRYEEGVAKVEEERRREQGNLTGLIDAMRVGQEAVRGEAAKLVNALRAAPKARGRWGEQQLRNVLETCGLAEHTDFETEVSVARGDERLRPDAIIRVPGERSLVVDAKVSLNAYQDAFGAVDEGERATHLSAHCASMKAHINALGSKAYWAEFADAPDYVIMFVPGEHFLSAALEHDSSLWDYAFHKRVLLATPTNLIAIARTVAAVWRQEKLAKDAQAIGLLGKEMHDRLAVAAGKLRTVGSGLNTAVKNYNDFVASFESRVMVTGRRFRDLNIETGAKEIEDVPPVELLPRYGEGAEVAE